MIETNAKGTKGYFLSLKNGYVFRVYEGKNFVDYKIRAEEINVEILSDYYSFYEENNEKFLDFSSKALGKDHTNLIKKKLEGIMKKDFVETWLKTPNNAFEGKTPLEIISEGNKEKIQEMIYRINSGEPI
jgi:hypothetical protein